MKQLIAVLLCLLALPAWAVDCKVGVYGAVPSITDGAVQVAQTLLDTMTASNVSISKAATSATSSVGTFPTGTLLLRVKCDGVAHFLISDDGTNATSADQSVGENEAEYFGASAGQRIEFIEAS
jgi:hypothetical protein